ncbi:cyclic pyranopterin monophosphate synthase [Pelagibacterium lentulum]|uniref:GTP 3',8-cyclase n=2 Tax=Pelagibacterium lentulum TaxID=2029865 RepID=A0A916VXJ6_9HYPH|nr:cyclic pyranopterin monophosphate synthase [Pelagibacterium lentulum]
MVSPKDFDFGAHLFAIGTKVNCRKVHVSSRRLLSLADLSTQSRCTYTRFMNMHARQTGEIQRPLIDSYGRQVNYLRVSVTDRCDFRCTYCMGENMVFLPKSEVLSFEEIQTIIAQFVARGVRKVRLTGGEPLVRRDIMKLIAALSESHLAQGTLDELTITTNGSQLARHAAELARLGIRRINVSLDTLDNALFTEITRRGRLSQVLEGIEAAQAVGIAVKLNMVAMKGVNEDEIIPMMEWAHARGYELTLIEAMPLGEVALDRADAHLSLKQVHDRIAERFTLEHIAKRTGGPARYKRVTETGGTLGFITPLSHNFCESCNRVRLTCTGQLYMCLGQDDRVDLRAALREGGVEALDAALDRAMIAKPKGHDFVAERIQTPSVVRHMSVTGG